MRILIVTLLGILWLPGFAFAATNCRVIEYPDHCEAVCIGDAKPTSDQNAPIAHPKAPGSAQETSTEPVAPSQVWPPTHASASDTSSEPFRTGTMIPSIAQRNHRPQTSQMAAAKASRNMLIMELLQQERGARNTAGLN